MLRYLFASSLIALASAGEARAQGGALRLNGAADYLTFPLDPSLIPAGGYTVELWSKIIVPAGYPIGQSGAGFLSMPGDVGSPSVLFRVYGGSVVYFGFQAGYYKETYASAPFTLAGAWHHYAAVHDGSTASIYLDGVLFAYGSGTGGLIYQPGSGRIGIPPGAVGAGAYAEFDELRIWDHPRTAAQINADRFRVLDQRAGLLSVWHFDGDFSDSVGGRHGVPNGGVATVDSTAPVARTVVVSPPAIAPGATWHWRVNTESVAASYWFDVSFSGASPGVALGGGMVAPLNRPWLFLDGADLLGAQLYSGFVESVGSDETGIPIFRCPSIPILDGAFMTASCAVFDPSTFAVLDVAPPKTTWITSTAPVITSVVPLKLPTTGGQATLTGTGFFPIAHARLDGVRIPMTYVSPTTVICAIPPGTASESILEVENLGGGTAIFADGFGYVLPLSLTQLTPEGALPGTSVTAIGGGFTAGTVVTVAGVTATVQSFSPDMLTFIVPPGTGCDASVVITTEYGQSASTVWNRTPDFVAGVNLQGPATGGGVFLLIGDFPSGCSVMIGGAAATIVSAAPTGLLGIAPPGVAGISTLVVSGAGGCSDGTAAYSYY